MRDYKVRTWLVALIAVLLPCVASATGLGKLNVMSALGQPLNAEIELTATREELATLNARLASPDAYRQANLQYNVVLPGARLSIERRGEQAYIKITSSRPVNEPFIDLLIELTWASGRMSREYTALIDPPGMAPEPAVSAVPFTRPAPAAQAPMAAAPARQPAVTRPITGAGGKEYGPIQRGETLGKIARSVLPEGVTLEQMLVGLYRSNPDAFIRKNLNLVRAGKVLRVPDKEDLATISRGEAAKEYRTHVADWNAYRQKIADAAGAAPAAEGRTTASGKITAKVEDKAGAAPKDVVRLSKGELPGAAGAGKGKPRSAAERARVLEEEAVAREKALSEANERVAQLEKTVKDMQKLVELKSPGMAAAQQQAQQAAKGKPAPAAKAEPAKPAEKAKPEAVAVAKPEPAKPEAAKPEPGKPAETPKPEAAKPAEAAKTDAPADKPAEKPAEKAEAPKPAPAPKAKPAAAPPPPPEPDLIEQVLSEPLYLGAAGGVILLGGVALWAARRRRTQADEDDSPPRKAPKLGKAAAAAAETAAVTAATPAAASSSASAPADEVDPLAEAEVYIAYGRDQQAEEILKEALTRNPKREDVQLKLLEIYSARKDKSAFGKLAGDLNKLTGGAGGGWTKAAVMGYALDPANPLYAAGKSAAPAARAGAAPAPVSDLDIDLGLGAGTGTATDISLDAGTTQDVREAKTAVFDPGAAQAKAAPLMPGFALGAAAPAQENSVIDFQIELPKAEEDPNTRHAAAPAAPRDADAGLDFKLDVPDLNIGGEAKTAAAGGDKDGHWYDVQTKFDLAKAYQEMGDKDGAQEILKEVIKEGDAEQKAQAQTLLDNLG